MEGYDSEEFTDFYGLVNELFDLFNSSRLSY